jgi:hypothetical protein
MRKSSVPSPIYFFKHMMLKVLTSMGGGLTIFASAADVAVTIKLG